MLIGHGDDGYLFNNKILANFSSNVYSQGSNSALKTHLKSRIDIIDNYPDAQGSCLVKILAEYHSLQEDNFVVTNGATEAFYLIAQLFNGQSATIVIPSFAEYEDSCRCNNIALKLLEWDSMSNETLFHTSLVYICNPNNPTGKVFTLDKIESLLRINHETIFVLDEAYIDFTTSCSSSLELLHRFKNLIIVKSLTKKFCIPGLRLGYLISNADIILELKKFKMPWSVNALALEAGKFIIENIGIYDFPLEQLLKDAKTLMYKVNDIKGFKAFQTFTNFFLCITEFGTAYELKKYLIENFEILIRDASNFKSLKEGNFRVCSQNDQQNNLLLEGLKSWSKKW